MKNKLSVRIEFTYTSAMKKHGFTNQLHYHIGYESIDGMTEVYNTDWLNFIEKIYILLKSCSCYIHIYIFYEILS